MRYKFTVNAETGHEVKADDGIAIHGAREHNLKNVCLTLPRNQLVVITGISGSGKSTLAFDLLFAEGQRRFLDSMNTYARQFVEQLARPNVDLIEGLPPTVSIEQRNSRGGGKSTVATITEIYHFLRLLFARLGTLYCPRCQVAVEPQSMDQVIRRLQRETKARGDLLLLAPAVKNRKGFHTEVAEWAAKHGYAEVRADGKMYSTRERLRLDRFREHNVEIVVGVLETESRRAQRAKKSPRELIEEALRLGQGTLLALGNDGKTTVFSTERVCVRCNRSYEALDPKHFSYNSPRGWCPRCRGFGELFYLPDVERGAKAESIEESWFEWQEGQRELCPECKGSRLNPLARAVRLEWEGEFEPGGRLRRGGKQAVGDLARKAAPSIDSFAQASVTDAYEYFSRLKLKGRSAAVARDILPEIRERMRFLCEVGLDYLQLGRGVTTLSEGEAQRIRLAAQLGSNLSGVLYILDEPTIGLHPRDNERLLRALEMLKRRGNSLVVVEHDEKTMASADYIVDLGPGAGVRGGEVVATGTFKEIMAHEESITGQCLRHKKIFPTRGKRRPVLPEELDRQPARSGGRGGAYRRSRLLEAKGKKRSAPPCLILSGATVHNLKDLKASFPLNRLVVVTGVSGSGKSSLVRDCLLSALRVELNKRGKNRTQDCAVSNFHSIKMVYEVDQSPIGRTPRSTPATYVGFFDEIRRLFAQLPEARWRGYSPSRFSFNSAQGRCPECQGAGNIKLEMNFLPPAFVPCESCQGTRFNRETLEIEYRGKNIAQILELSMAEAVEFFGSFPKIRGPLDALRDTGLDYLKLGQPSPTLSGGEAQRIKLVTHLLSGLKEPLALFESMNKRNLFILEEPTIGLHMADVRRLLEVLQRLIDAGHSVIVIEHNLDVIAEADWVIDLGPEGGDAGGEIVAEGTPEEIARNKRSHTGRFLRAVLPTLNAIQG